MLLLGSCNVTVVPTGGSTFSYAATAMCPSQPSLCLILCPIMPHMRHEAMKRQIFAQKPRYHSVSLRDAGGTKNNCSDLWSAQLGDSLCTIFFVALEDLELRSTPVV